MLLHLQVIMACVYVWVTIKVTTVKSYVTTSYNYVKKTQGKIIVFNLWCVLDITIST